MKYRFESKGRSHIHLLNEKPLMGTTTIINEVRPPPLAWYGSAKALEPMGFITEKKEPDEVRRRGLAEDGKRRLATVLEGTLEDYMGFLEDCYRNHDEYKKAKGKEGVDKHAEIEEYIKECLAQGGTVVHQSSCAIPEFMALAERDVQRFLWSEAHCFSDKLWVGGITDFGFLNKEGLVIVGDAKTGIYHKHFVQTAAYGLQIKENGMYTSEGDRIDCPVDAVHGYFVWDYNKGIGHYVGKEWVSKLESEFIQMVEDYKNKDVIGAPTL